MQIQMVCDGDGVTNGQEVADGTDPLEGCDLVVDNQTVTPSDEWLNGDCDGDGVTNGQEVADGTDPLDGCDLVVANQTVTASDEWLNGDCDGDGAPNGQEVIDGTDPLDPCDLSLNSQTLEPSDEWNNADCDEDGVLNAEEFSGDTDGDDIPDFQDPDDDNDGIPTIEEDNNGNGNWFDDDCDEDGIVDYLDPDSCDLVPNAFSPGSDGINDTWVIPLLKSYPNFSLEVYDRWGNIVYEYHNEGKLQPKWWDGRSTGRLNYSNDVLPTGTYYYVISFNDGDREPMAGWVYLVNNN